MTKRQKILVILLCLSCSLLTFVLTAVGVTAAAAGAVLYGDANGDGSISAADVLLLRQYFANFDYNTNTSTIHLGPQCGHQYEAQVTPPTCTKPGFTTHVCALCGDTYTDSEVAQLGHDFSGDFVTDIPATRYTPGSKSHHCSRCSEITDVTVIPALDGTRLYYVEPNGKILFGTYPQSEVRDPDLIAQLDAKVGQLPSSAPKEWKSYHYYVNGAAADFIWYRDITLGGNTYRGVYFTAYRPYWTDGDSSPAGSWQDDNGYQPDEIFWFRFEPVSWTRLTEKDGAWLLVADMILDSREFNASGSSSYAESAIRRWLNEDFRNTAFTPDEAAIIRSAKIPNNAASANPSGSPKLWNNGVNPNTCPDTDDRIFLLSVEDVTNPAYGFGAYNKTDAMRVKAVSDYAAAQGAYRNTAGNGWWWLRSPDFAASDLARGIYLNGYADSTSTVCDAGYGVVPALWIRY